MAPRQVALRHIHGTLSRDPGRSVLVVYENVLHGRDVTERTYNNYAFPRMLNSTNRRWVNRTGSQIVPHFRTPSDPPLLRPRVFIRGRYDPFPDITTPSATFPDRAQRCGLQFFPHLGRTFFLLSASQTGRCLRDHR